MQIGFPFGFDKRGRTTQADELTHIRQMIEVVLFTNPGERVNRPDFGSGLLQLVFGPNSHELAAAVHANVHAALQRWLGDLIDVQHLEVESIDARLLVTIDYVVARSQERRTDTFEKRAGP